MDITPYLNLLRDKNGSDLFFTVGSPVKVKIEGTINSVGKTVLTSELTKGAAYGIMNDRQIRIFEETMECDFAIALPDKSARFRVNVFRQRGEVGMVLRRIPAEIPDIESLGLPDILGELIMAKRGLGPLHGIPFAAKDIFCTAGIRTTGHSRICADHVPDIDATTVRKLKEAGAILLGKLATHEMAMRAQYRAWLGYMREAA